MRLGNVVLRKCSMNIVHVGVSILMLTSANVAAEDTKTTNTSSVKKEDVPQVAILHGETPVTTNITPQKNEQKPDRRIETTQKIHIPRTEVIQTGKTMAAERGWTGNQWRALYQLWEKESGWNPKAVNPSSGAYGIPQALPAAKLRSAGSDWRTNPRTQIEWGMNYIQGRYGTPVQAWQHSQTHNWY